MQRLILKPGDPLVLTLAADAQVTQTDYFNDHIWELKIGGGEPSALSVETTFGLRAKSMRIFPVFKKNNHTIVNPDDFAPSLKIETNYPNFIALSFIPITDIDVRMEYWVPDSHQIAGKMTLTNKSLIVANIRVDWAALLTPTNQGERMTPIEFGAVTVLAGKSENLALIFFMTGGPIGESGPYTCLSKEISLEQGSSHQLIWVLAALDEHQDSFEQARLTASKNWNGISATLDMIHSGNLDINTGNNDWNTTFQMAQKVALNSLMSGTNYLPKPSYVLTRLPDQGFSKRGDGSDYDHLWNGQTPLETYFLIDFLFPSHAEIAKGLLNNFLENQADHGFIDWKMGLNGNRSQILATPILATIALKIFKSCNDIAYLESIFPKLMAFFISWFDEHHDKDHDHIPEWDHVLQTGFEDNLLFSYWHDLSYGTAISKIESPDLCAFLFRECKSLIEISKILSTKEYLEYLKDIADHLLDVVNNSWNETLSSYQYRDRDTHTQTKKQHIGEHTGAGDIIINTDFDEPLRLNFSLQAKDVVPYEVQLFIHGTTQSGAHRVERLSADRFQWHLRKGYATSDLAYKSIEYIHIQGVATEDTIEISSLDFQYQNQSTLLPLWAGMPSRKRAKNLIKKTLTDPNRYWQSYGVRTTAIPPNPEDESSIFRSVNIIWNGLLIEGLLYYGYRSLAAELIQRNMQAIIFSLKKEHAFRQLYLAEHGTGIGERNIISALAPIGPFLMALGVHIVSQRRIMLSAFNPFPWSVTINYRGLTVIRQKKSTMIIFPNGKNLTVRNGKSQIVTIE